MKRLFTMLLACSLMITATSSLCTIPVLASEEVATESSTLAPEDMQAPESSSQVEDAADSTDSSVNLIDTEEEAVAERPVNLEDRGSSFGLEALEGRPDLTCESAILMDAKSGAILCGKDYDTKRYPASITKVMTTLVAIENCKMDDIVTFTSSAVYGIEEGSSTAGINVGAELTVEETLYALMLVSANEAGAAIAEHVSGSTEEFAKLMTSRAKELGCTGTNFMNPHGLPDEQHYTTAHDMGLIMQEALKYEEFRRFASTINYTIPKRETLDSEIDLWNHAKILRKNSEYYYEYAVGAKTGFTQAALNTLVTYAEKDGVELLTVILKDYGADNSYYDTAALFKWGFDKVKNITPLANLDMNALLSEAEGIPEKQLNAFLTLNPTVDKGYPVLVTNNFDESTLSKAFRLDEDMDAGRLGYIEVKSGDTLILSSPVTYDTETQAAKNYVTDQGGGDDLETADVPSKRSLLRSFGSFMLRVIIACILVFAIMQGIHRWQAEQRRKERIKKRKQKRNGAPSNEIATGKTNGKAPQRRSSKSPSRKSSSTGSKQSTSSSTASNDSNTSNSSNIVRKRRHPGK